MGLYISRLISSFYSGEGRSSKIVMLGLDNAGKTTVLYRVKLNEDVVTIPTLGFNVETVSPVKGVTFTVWDVGGQKSLRQLWKHYYTDCKGLLYVVDSADVDRMEESREELEHICSCPEMAGVPVVIFANKQDLPGACTTSEVAQHLAMTSLKNRKWFIQGACATSGQGIHEGLNELSRLSKDFQTHGNNKP